MAPKKKSAKKTKKAAARTAPKKAKTAKKAKKTAARTAKRAAPKRAKKTARKTAAKRAPAVRVHPVVHWEIQSASPDRLHTFYAEALGWKIDANNPMNYGLVASGGIGGINGGIGGNDGSGSRVTVYAQVPSIEEVLQRVESLGGQTMMPRTDVGPVIMALYSDPEGNVMGLIED